MCTVQRWYSVYITHVFDGATCENMISFPPIPDYWLKQQSNKESVNPRSRSILMMDVSGLFCFALFPAGEETPQCLCFSPSNEFCCGHVQTSRAVQGCHSIRLAEQHRSRVPDDKSAFSLPKEYLCMFKAHSRSLENLFLFGICLTLSTFSGFSSSLVHQNWSVSEPPWHFSVQ